jgi:hypothetical protein
MNENGHFKFKDMEKVDCLASMLKMIIMKMVFARPKILFISMINYIKFFDFVTTIF